jgi:hypothetical protein
MLKKKLTAEQKKLDMDIWIIAITSFVVFGLYIAAQDSITPYVRNSNENILLRTLFAAAFQFGLAGLGISIVSIIRKESFLLYGLRKKCTLLSVALCSLCFVPYILFILISGGGISYMPFQTNWTTKEILASGFPVNIAGMSITAVAWGFFEGFNYVVISEKINKRYPRKNRWLNWGAIVCAVFCILIHGAIGVTAEGIIEMIAVLIIIYGMLMVKEFTANAWGCVFVFMFLWNAFIY